MKFCTFCGEKLSENYKYCPTCGEVQNKESKEDRIGASIFSIPFSKIIVSKYIIYFIYILTGFIEAYIFGFPTSNNFSLVILIVLPFIVNFSVIHFVGHSTLQIVKISMILFATSFVTLYLNYDFTPEEYVDYLLGIDGIADDSFWFSIFLVSCNIVIYYLAVFSSNLFKKVKLKNNEGAWK